MASQPSERYLRLPLLCSVGGGRRAVGGGGRRNEMNGKRGREINTEGNGRWRRIEGREGGIK